MLTMVTLKANVILTYDDGEQDIYDATALAPTLVPHYINQVVVDVLEQFLEDRPGDSDLSGLVKISLCYMFNGSADTLGTQLMINLLVDGNNGKFYFQPNQRSDVERLLMKQVPGLATETKDFSAN